MDETFQGSPFQGFKRGDPVWCPLVRLASAPARFLAYSPGSGGAWVQLPDDRGRSWVALDDLEALDG